MPVVIPIIAAFASGAVAAVVAGTATFAAYATVAGAVLSVAGAVSGNKDLQRIGGYVGIVGGLASFATGVSDVAASGVSTTADGAQGVSTGDTGFNPGADSAAADTTGAVTSPVTSGNVAPITGAPTTGAPVTAGDATASSAAPGTVAPPSTAVTGTPGQSLAQMAQDNGIATSGVTAQADGTVAATPTTAATDQSGMDLAADAGKYGSNNPMVNAVSKNYSASDLNSWWQKAQDAGTTTAKFLKDNKDLVSIAGSALKDMYGPQAEALDYQKSLMAQAHRNINTPVVLKYN